MLTHNLLLIFQVSLLPLFSEQMKKNEMLEVALYQESRLVNTGCEPILKGFSGLGGGELCRSSRGKERG